MTGSDPRSERAGLGQYVTVSSPCLKRTDGPRALLAAVVTPAVPRDPRTRPDGHASRSHNSPILPARAKSRGADRGRWTRRTLWRCGRDARQDHGLHRHRPGCDRPGRVPAGPHGHRRRVHRPRVHHIEAFKAWLATTHGLRTGRPLHRISIKNRLINLHCFFDRITDWGYPNRPQRPLVFASDLPIVDKPLPRFLDDAAAAKLLRTSRADPDPLARLIVELLARTGMRSSELRALTVDAVVQIGSAYWLRIPIGKLHNDRYLPLHPQLKALLDDWIAHHRPTGLRSNRFLLERHRPLPARRVATALVYARIPDKTVADEYFKVTEKVEALYHQPRQLPAADEGTEMRRLRAEMHRRMLGNGYCARPVEMDCHFESICESCTFFVTTIAFRPTLQQQRDDAERKGQVGRQKLFDGLLTRHDQQAAADS